MSFQDNLRMYRERLGINAKDFAAQLGIKYTTYANYENQGREPKYDVLCKIAAALHVSIDELVGFTPDKLQYWRDIAERAGVYIQLNRNKSTGNLSFTLDIDGKPISPFMSAVQFVKDMEELEKETDNALNSARDVILSLKIRERFMISYFEMTQDK